MNYKLIKPDHKNDPELEWEHWQAEFLIAKELDDTEVIKEIRLWLNELSEML